MTSEPSMASRAGFVALMGAPNAGKSTLLNQLVGTKIAIVTHKVQTTRTVLRGVVMHENAQIVFVDTPGIFAPKRSLDRVMVKAAWSAASDADVCVLLVDAERGIKGDVLEIAKRFDGLSQKIVLLINKIDKVPRSNLLELSAELNRIYAFDETFMLAAIRGEGTQDIVTYLAEQMPESPYLYPPDQVSDLPLRILAAEITREKLYLRLHQELPYASHVETEAWEEREDGSVKLDQVIYVQRDSQKKIVIGKGGETIKAISAAARLEIAKLIGQKVHLFLFVKVRENWANDPERYRAIGLDVTG